MRANVSAALFLEKIPRTLFRHEDAVYLTRSFASLLLPWLMCRYMVCIIAMGLRTIGVPPRHAHAILAFLTVLSLSLVCGPYDSGVAGG